MAPVWMGMGLAAAGGGRMVAARATKSISRGGGATEQKGLLGWILGGLQKEDQLLEIDPILKKVEEKNDVSKKPAASVSVPNNNKKKFGGFGGLFAKN